MALKIEPVQPNLKTFHSDDMRWRPKGYVPVGERVPPGTDVQGVYFDGYPQIWTQEGSQPKYKIKVEKDIMVPMEDGVRLAVDVYRPDVEGVKFPGLLSFFGWGKELQETARWLRDIPLQEYYDSPFWDGSIEAGDNDYLVERGYIHVIAEPRNIGQSDGKGQRTS